MVLYTKKKLAVVAVFSFLTLLTATSVCSAQKNQGNQDSAWLDSFDSNQKVLNQDLANIIDALNSDDQSTVSTNSLAMYQHSKNALDESTSYQVSDEYKPMKERYETFLNDLNTASNFLNQGDNAQALKYIDKAKNDNDDLINLNKALAEKKTATDNTAS